MPGEYKNNEPNFIRHSDEMQDIITAVPSKLIRWGMFLFTCVFLMIIGLAAFIHFPDMVNTTLKVSNNSLAELVISRAAKAKVHSGQEVIVDFKSYQSGPNDVVKGKIVHISDSINNNGNYIAEVLIRTNIPGANNSLHLKPGMQADAHIIIQDVSVLKRVCQDIFH